MGMGLEGLEEIAAYYKMQAPKLRHGPSLVCSQATFTSLAHLVRCTLEGS